MPILEAARATHRALRRRRLIVVLACPACMTTALLGQADSGYVTVSGTVVDLVRQPIEGAELLVVGTQIKASTNAKGWFLLRAPLQPQLLVQVRRIGFGSQVLRFDGSWTGIILLTPGIPTMPDITVTAAAAKPARYSGTSKYDDVFRRRLLGMGDLIDRKQIDDRGAIETAQLLEGRAGIKVQIRHSESVGDVEGTIVSFSRCSEFPPKINVYVDGRKLIPHFIPLRDERSALTALSSGQDVSALDTEARRQLRARVGEMLARVNPSDIEMIEIFRGPGQLPAEFNDGNCGAIAIWTREGGR